MTTLDRREAALDAAREDARHAVDLLLDAIGRILLAHIPDAPAPAPAIVSRTRWTPEEHDLFTAHYPEGGSAACINAGLNRTALAISLRAHRLGIAAPSNLGGSSARKWTPAEDNLLRKHYAEHGVKGVLEAGVNRTTSAIYARAVRLGVKHDHRNTNADAASEAIADVAANPAKPSTPPPGITRTLTQQVLDALLAADARDTVLDAELLTRAEQGALRKLRRDKLATQASPGLWRPTLAAISQQRNAT